MSKKCNLEDRIPKAVCWGEGQCGYRVGHSGVTRMEVVEVPGPTGYHPWVEVYQGGDLVARVNCSMVEELLYNDD